MVVETDIIIRLVLAALIGSVLGFERKVHNRPGGTRAHALVCLGSTLFTITSLGFDGAADPSRIAAGIVTGIGFLGAGTIFRDKNNVRGLTTAASIWAVAGVGLAIGTGALFIAAVATVAMLITLELGRLQATILGKKRKYNTG